LGAGMPMDTKRLFRFVPMLPELVYHDWKGSSFVAIATVEPAAMPLR